MPTDPSRSGRPQKWPPRDRYAFRLWLVVSALWTTATVLRVIRVWVPAEGWRATLEGFWLWVELAIPPLMFGAIIFAVRQVAGNRAVIRIPLPWCRRT